MTAKQRKEFQKMVLGYYATHGRHDLPWRMSGPDGEFDPYHILVSELMLQQTQVARVIPKYQEFLDVFPTIQALAAAPLGAVLTAWNGLGYNRRAKFLWQAVRMIVDDFGGVFPRTVPELVRLPGVGKNTAGAILAYAFNQPAVFIETNIRTVYIHHFCNDQTSVRQLLAREVPPRRSLENGGVSDTRLVTLVGHTLDTANPRVWYWALMDYGSYLKQSKGNLNKLSKSYTVQPPFQGSLRQIRGQIIRLLTVRPMSLAELEGVISDGRLGGVLKDLLREDMIQIRGNEYLLA